MTATARGWSVRCGLNVICDQATHSHGLPPITVNQSLGRPDLLGCDSDRAGHVIEVKIRPDPQLGIQALDYWAWVNARRAELAKTIGADPDRPLYLDLVLGGKAAEMPVHPAAAATLNALAREVNWRCHIITNWDTTEEPKTPLTPRRGVGSS